MDQLGWLKSRQKGIGSSDSPVLVLGSVFEQTPLDLYLAKKEVPKIVSDNKHFRRGHTYEPLAIALYEDQTGIKVHTPQTDQERFVDFQRWHPTHRHMFADFDGIASDGWVIEVKSPTQRTCEQIRAEGVKDYYQIQCHHLAYVANSVPLPGIGEQYNGKINGTRLIIYEPEGVDLMVYDLPFDEEFGSAIAQKCESFWNKYVATDTPPLIQNKDETIIKRIKQVGGDYVTVDSNHWIAATEEYRFAAELHAAAKNRLERAKQQIKDAMEAFGHEAIIAKNGYKFLHKEQQGRSSLDEKALRAAYPGIDLEAFKKRGNPFKTFRSYLPMEKDGNATPLESQIENIRESLENYDPGERTPSDVQRFDELKNVALLYQGLLENESGNIRDLLKDAAERLAGGKKV